MRFLVFCPLFSHSVRVSLIIEVAVCFEESTFLGLFLSSRSAVLGPLLIRYLSDAFGLSSFEFKHTLL